MKNREMLKKTLYHWFYLIKNTKLLKLSWNYAVCYATICYGKPILCYDKWNVYAMVRDLYTMSWNFNDMLLDIVAMLWCMI